LSVSSEITVQSEAHGDLREYEASPEVAARPLRVAHVITSFSAGAGGITLRGAAGLDKARYSSTILAGPGGTFVSRAEEAGVAVIPLRQMTPARRVNPWFDVRTLDELVSHLAAGQFDLVHTHSAKAGALGRIAARKVGVPAVVHSFHGFPFHDFQSLPVRTALLAIERRLARMTDFFVTDGTMVAAQAVRLKLAPPERIRAIASPIDDDIVAVSEVTRRRARRLLGVPESAKVVGTVARLDRQKAPLDMVEAVAALGRSDVWTVWVGDGNLRAKTERLIRRRGLEDRFLLVGNRSDVSFLLPGFDVFALSSLYEGLPCAVVEAMKSGVPVVATAVNSVPEIVISGKTGLLARPGDPRSLTRALAYLLDHRQEALRMARAARDQVGDRFRPEALAHDLMEVYELALQAARSG
jgi:glycosyltransferase involved in cell wall biosynthesis